MNLKSLIHRAVILGLLTISGVSSVFAQHSGYSQTNLVANSAGVANHTDAQLSNPWGISFIPGQPFWIANNNGGTSTEYDAQGNKVQPTVVIPVAAHNPCPQGCPTGTVANDQAGLFSNASFLFDTEDGIIAAWTGQNNAFTVVDNSASGAVYKGLALLTNNEGTFLLAANFNSGQIDVFDRNFNPAHLTGNLTDPNLPAGFAPHNVKVVNGVLLIAYAKQDNAKHDPVIGDGLGIVDAFDLEGNFRGSFASGALLDAPWGMVAAPPAFGDLSNDILIGNFGDGKINAYTTAGQFVGTLSNSAGQVIATPGLWDLVFGAGGTGDPNTLYFTAGGASQTNGLFGTFIPATAVNGADFSLNFSSQSITVPAGGTSTLTIGSAAVGGFNGQVTLSCAPVAGITCSFNPNTVTPGTPNNFSMLTITASATPPGGGYGHPGALLLSGLGLLGTISTRRKLACSKGKNLVLIALLSLLVTGAAFTIACGNYSNRQPNNNHATLTVTGTSTGISHSTPVTVNIQ